MSLDFDTVCNLEKGFECLNSAQDGMECGDYEVSFQCDCGTTSQIPTTISNVTGTPSPPKPACGWTNFINSYPRTPTSTGDYETIHNVRMKYEFCEFPCESNAGIRKRKKTIGLSVRQVYLVMSTGVLSVKTTVNLEENARIMK
ncbi:hypothetical protein MAR_034904 [Mya arenaria]|uniref:WxxW domain-containing protein n=1 Tax=Mya arenaria TaxID=6604 RepID=A0ABY7EIL1_MYAAR|nr:hypothetical protein MAR_034904 [Mya arenaria]